MNSIKGIVLFIVITFFSINSFSQNVITPPAAWNDDTKWSDNNIADVVSEDTDFDGNNLGEVVVLDGDDYTVGNVDLKQGNIFTIASGGTMNIGISGTPRNLTSDNQTEINVNGDLTIWGNLIVKTKLTINVSGNLTIKGNVDIQNQAEIDISGNVFIDGNFTSATKTDVTVDGLLDVGGTVTVGPNSILDGTGTVNIGIPPCNGPDSFCLSGPLPVELLNFLVKSSPSQVLLSWSTASEINNDYFTLEKSKNGKDFVGMGTVTGNGTVNILSNYSFTDNLPYLGLSYYRLSQTDYDGTTEIFPIISVVFTNKTTNFSISPNPAANPSVILKVSGKAKYELLELNIIDLQGKLVEQKYFKTDDYGNFETEFQLKKQLQKRTYIFELVSGNQKEYLKVIGN